MAASRASVNWCCSDCLVAGSSGASIAGTVASCPLASLEKPRSSIADDGVAEAGRAGTWTIVLREPCARPDANPAPATPTMTTSPTATRPTLRALNLCVRSTLAVDGSRVGSSVCIVPLRLGAATDRDAPYCPFWSGHATAGPRRSRFPTQDHLAIRGLNIFDAAKPDDSTHLRCEVGFRAGEQSLIDG